MTHQVHGQAADPHIGHKVPEAHASHDRHAGHSVAMFRDKFWLSFSLTIPVIFWSADVQHWLGYRAPSFPGSNLIAPILGTVVFVYGGLVFIRGAWGELADHKPGMMTLISLAITVAFGTSLAATFGLFEIEVWWELASLITIMVLGHSYPAVNGMIVRLNHPARRALIGRLGDLRAQRLQLGSPLLQFIDRAGTDALVAVSHGLHGVRFDQNFRYMGWKWLKQAKQLTAGKCSKHTGFPTNPVKTSRGRSSVG